MPKFKMFDELAPRVLANIDEMVLREVTPYIKTMAALPSEIQAAATEQAKLESAEQYADHLVGGWHQHNLLATEIDAFLVQFYQGSLSFTDNEVVNVARGLIHRAFATEKCKRIYSAGVKLSIAEALPKAVTRYGLAQAQVQFLLSCWRIDFWRTRFGMHAEYLLARASELEQAASLRSGLVETFHAQEDILLEVRLAHLFPDLCAAPLDVLSKKVDDYRLAQRMSLQDMAAGGYLIQERGDLRAIQKLVDYDNREEYLFGSNLWGMPDLFLRKEIEHHLVKLGVFDQRSSVVFYSLEEFDDGLRQMELMNAEFSVAGTHRATRSAGLPTDHSNNLWGSLYHDDTRGASGA